MRKNGGGRGEGKERGKKEAIKKFDVHDL